MPEYKLTSFNFSGSRGEECRLALHLAGVEFEDERISPASWRERKSTTPFGAMPVLEVAGKGTLAQSNAILRFVGQAHGLHPSDPWQAARHEAIMCAVEDLRAKIDPTMRMEDPVQKQRAREELATGWLQTWGANIEKQIAGPFVAGERIHVVDLKLYVIVNWFARGTLDHIPADLFRGFPKLMRLYAAVKDHPKVAEWVAKTSN
jgi:glutathione S-transferase